MQYELFDDFKDGMVMTAIPLSWYKRVTAFIKGFGGGGVVKVRTENGAPNVTMDVSISQKADINTEMKPYKDEEGTRVTDSPFDGDGENTVSWGINEENENDKNGCIVTLPTRLGHPTVTDPETQEETEDTSKWRMFFRSFAKSPSGITAAITKEIGYIDVAASGEEGDNPTDISGKMTETYVATDTPPVSGNPVWEAGGDDGYVEDAIVATDRANSGGSLHRLWHVKKHYSSDGRLLKVEGMTAADYVRV